MGQNWRPTNRRGHRRCHWKGRVLAAALAIGRDFTPAELGVPSLANVVDAVQYLHLSGDLDLIRGDRPCQWTYRLTEAGRSRAERLAASPAGA